MSTRDRPLLVAPAPLIAIAVLLLNDHVLKALAPGWVTGKLSDFAGLVFFPAWLLAVLEVVLARPLRTPLHARVAACVVGGVFAAVKLHPFATAGYSLVWGTLQWPVYALVAYVGGDALPPLLPVACVKDPSDLIALGVLLPSIFAATPPQGRSGLVVELEHPGGQRVAGLARQQCEAAR